VNKTVLAFIGGFATAVATLATTAQLAWRAEQNSLRKRDGLPPLGWKHWGLEHHDR
jgi:hypothetical protein